MAQDEYEESEFEWVGESDEYQQQATLTEEEAADIVEEIRHSDGYEYGRKELLHSLRIKDNPNASDYQPTDSLHRNVHRDGGNEATGQYHNNVAEKVKNYLTQHHGSIEIQDGDDTYTNDEIAETMASAFAEEENIDEAARLAKKVGQEYDDRDFWAIVGTGLKQKYGDD